MMALTFKQYLESLLGNFVYLLKVKLIGMLSTCFNSTFDLLCCELQGKCFTLLVQRQHHWYKRFKYPIRVYWFHPCQI